jgi:hypothetical protein
MASWSERRGHVPHRDATTIDDRRVRHDDVWQRRNLVRPDVDELLSWPHFLEMQCPESPR